jgi:hypothetical protein
MTLMDKNTELQRLGYYEYFNGVRHADLTQRAMEILRADMSRYGNSLSTAHEAALYEILGSYTRLAQGNLRGRFAYPLDCGLGKTLSVVAWLTALHEVGADHIGIIVAASKVEALCEMKRKLIAHGVPEAKVGLVHSYRYDKGEASLPTTTDHDARQILLVTHQRIRGGRGLEDYNTYREGPRAFAIWDEALMVSDARAVSARRAFAELDWLKRMKGDDERFAPLIARFSEADAAIAAEAKRQRESRTRASALRLPPLTEREADAFSVALKYTSRVAPLADLLAMWHEPLRIAPTTDGDAVITYRLVVPRELGNVAVLDASYEIRRLEQLGDNVQLGSKWHTRLKDYSRVSVRQIRVAGGREAVTKDFRSRKKGYADAVVDFIREVPEHEACIIFTFKPDARSRVDFAAILQEKLTQAGIDPAASVAEGKPRFVWRTWGQHEGDSDFSYATHVALCGVLHRSRVELAGAMVGELDDLEATVTDQDISDLVRSEKAHCVLQALSRGACRTVRDGVAGRMRVLILDRSPRLREDLARVTPGIVWELDRDQKSKQSGQKSGPVVEQLTAYLRGLAEDVRRMSVRDLKGTTGDLGVHANTFTRALHEASGIAGWVVAGRSVLRAAG